MSITFPIVVLVIFNFFSSSAFAVGCDGRHEGFKVYSAQQVSEQIRKIDDFNVIKGINYPAFKSCVIDRSRGDAFTRSRISYDDETLIMVEDFIDHLSIITLRYRLVGATEVSSKVKMYVRSDKEQKYIPLMASETPPWVREPRISHSYPHSYQIAVPQRYHLIVLIEYGNKAPPSIYGVTFLGEKIAVD